MMEMENDSDKEEDRWMKEIEQLLQKDDDEDEEAAPVSEVRSASSEAAAAVTAVSAGGEAAPTTPWSKTETLTLIAGDNNATDGMKGAASGEKETTTTMTPSVGGSKVAETSTATVTETAEDNAPEVAETAAGPAPTSSVETLMAEAETEPAPATDSETAVVVSPSAAVDVPNDAEALSDPAAKAEAEAEATATTPPAGETAEAVAAATTTTITARDNSSPEITEAVGTAETAATSNSVAETAAKAAPDAAEASLSEPAAEAVAPAPPPPDPRDETILRLEHDLARVKLALSQREDELRAQAEEAERRCKRMQEETGAKINEFKRQFLAANRDKEAMVMKYALGEKEVILQRKAKEDVERRLKVALKDKDDLQAKVKVMNVDIVRTQQVADSRLQDVAVLKKDVERWQEEVKVQEAKTCVANARLKAESDAHRETREQLDQTIRHLSETRKEIDATRKECSDFMQKIRLDEATQQRRLDAQEKEQSVKLMIDAKAASEMDAMREKYARLVDENNLASQRVQRLESERLQSDEAQARLKETVTGLKSEAADLMAQVAEMEGLKLRLQRQDERHEAQAAEIERLRAETAETSADMSSCREKEAELLAFTQKLTDKNVTLQSDLALLEAKSSSLEAEHARSAGRLAELETAKAGLDAALDEERAARRAETDLLVKKLAEKSRLADDFKREALDAQNEVQVLKRRSAASQRELTRELQAWQKKAQAVDAQGPAAVRQTAAKSPNAAASLSNGGGQAATTPAQQQQHSNGLPNNTHELNALQKSQMHLPESHVLVDKIVKLQRSLAKKQEKLEFLEEHMSTMLDEVKKKNRIIQHYLMQQETAGALVSGQRDENKRKMSEQGGIMASLYSSKSSDSNMTLELSLEINQKLQAVLEDTLLKNITLKDNIDTLGNEIAKISSQNSSSSR